MNRTLKTLMSGLMIAMLAVVTTSSVEAASITLTDGTTTVTVVDNGAGDTDPLTGVITFFGAVGAFQFNISSGTTKPVAGSATDPQMGLFIAANSVNTGGTLTISFNETGFGPNGPMIALATAEGSASLEGTLTYATFQNATLLTSESAAGGPYVFNETAAAASGTYSLTQVVSMTHSANGLQTSTFLGFLNLDPVAVPDGGWAISLLGFGLMGVEGLRRRFTRV